MPSERSTTTKDVAVIVTCVIGLVGLWIKGNEITRELPTKDDILKSQQLSQAQRETLVTQMGAAIADKIHALEMKVNPELVDQRIGKSEADISKLFALAEQNIRAISDMRETQKDQWSQAEKRLDAITNITEQNTETLKRITNDKYSP